MTLGLTTTSQDVLHNPPGVFLGYPQKDGCSREAWKLTLYSEVELVIEKPRASDVGRVNREDVFLPSFIPTWRPLDQSVNVNSFYNIFEIYL